MDKNNDEYLLNHGDELYDPFVSCIEDVSILDLTGEFLFQKKTLNKLPKKVQKLKISAPLLQQGSVFGEDNDNDDLNTIKNDGEMPKFAKLRMRNIGKETIRGTGLTSFYNFRDSGFVGKKLWEKSLEEISKKMDD